MPRVQRVKSEGRGVNSISPERRKKLSEMDCDSVNYTIDLSINTPFRVQRSTNLGLLAAQARPHENSSVKFSVKKIDATILGHHLSAALRGQREQ